MILEGARQTLSKANAPTLMLEFIEHQARAAGGGCAHIYARLVEFGYSLYTYDPSEKKLVPEACREDYTYSNLIACKNRSAVEARLCKGWSRWHRLE